MSAETVGSMTADDRTAGDKKLGRGRRGGGGQLHRTAVIGVRLDPRLKYLAEFASHLQTFADKVRPQLVLVSAGFDTHRLDPIGSLGLEVEDFATLTRHVLDIASVHAQGRLVSVLEGGYNLEMLPLCVGAHLSVLQSHT